MHNIELIVSNDKTENQTVTRHAKLTVLEIVIILLAGLKRTARRQERSDRDGTCCTDGDCLK